jgi:hypothetical protein
MSALAAEQYEKAGTFPISSCTLYAPPEAEVAAERAGTTALSQTTT